MIIPQVEDSLKSCVSPIDDFSNTYQIHPKSLKRNWTRDGFFWVPFSHGPMARGGYHPAQENEEVDETAGEPIGLGDGHGLISLSAAL